MATPRKYISSFIAILILMFASSLEAAVARTTTPTHSSKAPKHTNKGKSDADICKMPFNHNNADQDKTTWNDSGAQDLLTTFLKEKGTKDWANNFLTKYAAGGTQGGTQYDCTSMWKSSCGPPADCLTYKPGSAFFVHTQMANLFGAFQTLYNRLVYDAVAAISTDIHQIVKEWGTPPKNQNDDIFQGLITALYTLAGIGATAETLGAGALAGDIGGPITIMAQVVGGIHMTDQPADPAALEAEIEDAYGQMFKSSVSSINSTVENIFNGFESKGKRQITGPTIPNPGEITNIVEENAIAGYFKDGKWLDNEINDAAINVYAKNMENKMKELALVQALKSGNKKGYCIAVYDPKPKDFYGSGMDEGTCKGKGDACIWNDNKCVCWAWSISSAFGPSTQSLKSDEAKDLKKYIVDYNAALINNYNCIKPNLANYNAKAGKRKGTEFNINKVPDSYYECFWNLDGCPGEKSK